MHSGRSLRALFRLCVGQLRTCLAERYGQKRSGQSFEFGAMPLDECHHLGFMPVYMHGSRNHSGAEAIKADRRLLSDVADFDLKPVPTKIRRNVLSDSPCLALSRRIENTDSSWVLHSSLT